MAAALITGAGKRLGRDMALFLAARGHDIAVHYASSQAAAEDTAQACRALGVNAVVVQADLLDLDAADQLVAQAVSAPRPPGCLGRRRSAEPQSIQWAADAGVASVEDVRVDHGRLHAAVAEQLLDRADVVAVLEQVGREGVAQGVGGHALAQARLPGGVASPRRPVNSASPRVRQHSL